MLSDVGVEYRDYDRLSSVTMTYHSALDTRHFFVAAHLSLPPPFTAPSTMVLPFTRPV